MSDTFVVEAPSQEFLVPRPTLKSDFLAKGQQIVRGSLPIENFLYEVQESKTSLTKFEN